MICNEIMPGFFFRQNINKNHRELFLEVLKPLFLVPNFIGCFLASCTFIANVLYCI